MLLNRPLQVKRVKCITSGENKKGLNKKLINNGTKLLRIKVHYTDIEDNIASITRIINIYHELYNTNCIYFLVQLKSKYAMVNADIT